MGTVRVFIYGKGMGKLTFGNVNAFEVQDFEGFVPTQIKLKH